MKVWKPLLFMVLIALLALLVPTLGRAQEDTTVNGWEGVKDAVYPVLYSEEESKKFSERAIAHGGEPPIFKRVLGDLAVAYVMVRQEDKVYILRSHLEKLGLSENLDEVHETAVQNLRRLSSGVNSPFTTHVVMRDGPIVDAIAIHSKVPWQARLIPSMLLLNKELFSIADSSLGILFKERRYYVLPLKQAILVMSGSEQGKEFLDYVVSRLRLEKKENILLSRSVYEISADGVVLHKRERIVP